MPSIYTIVYQRNIDILNTKKKKIQYRYLKNNKRINSKQSAMKNNIVLGESM
jgi:hypothetical protein